MSQTQSTRCPHCQTAFRVTADQLAAARGAVRCGSCLQVFNATEYLLDNAPARTRRRPAEKPAGTAPADRSAETSHWVTPPEAPDEAPTFDDDEGDLLFNAEEDDDILFMDDDDEDYDLTEDDDTATSDTSSPEFSDSFLSLDDASDTLEADTESDETAQAADDSWALDMLASMEQEDAGTQPTRHEDMTLADLDAGHHPPGERARAQAPSSSRRATHAAQLEAAFANRDLDEMADQMDAPTHRRWPWLLGTGVLALLLLAQIGWWERQRLSQQPGLQTVYQTVCNLVGCDLPEAIPDAGSIRALSSVLRPLPDGRMRLDAVFVNRSERPSPFPMLKLTVEDFQGNTLADGLFAPEDYVGGELRPSDLMPPGRPVSISLNLERPVEDLNNFRLTFHY